MDDLLARMSPVDLVIIEGFKTWRHDKLEIHRPAVGKPLLAADDPTIVAVASDATLGDIGRPVFDLNDIDAIADFIIGHLGLNAGVSAEARDGAA